MDLHRFDLGGNALPPRNGGEGCCDLQPIEHLAWFPSIHLNSTSLSQLCKPLSQKDQPLARQSEPTQQRLVEYKHRWKRRVGGQCGVVVAERLSGEPHNFSLAGALNLRRPAGRLKIVIEAKPRSRFDGSEHSIVRKILDRARVATSARCTETGARFSTCHRANP